MSELYALTAFLLAFYGWHQWDVQTVILSSKLKSFCLDVSQGFSTQTFCTGIFTSFRVMLLSNMPSTSGATCGIDAYSTVGGSHIERGITIIWLCSSSTDESMPRAVFALKILKL